MKKKKKLSNDNKTIQKDFSDTFFKITLGFDTKIGQILYFLFLDIYLLIVFMIAFYIKNFVNHFFRIGFVDVMATISLIFFYLRFFVFFNCRKRNSILYNLLCWILIALYIFLFIKTLPPRGDGTWSEKLDEASRVQKGTFAPYCLHSNIIRYRFITYIIIADINLCYNLE